MQDNWLFFLGLALLMTSWDAGLLQSRGFACAGSCLGSLLGVLATVAFIAGFFVGPWWGPLVAIPAMVLIGTTKLLALDLLLGQDLDSKINGRFALAFAGGIAGVACIAWWYFR
jgi:hypothetical protein